MLSHSSLTFAQLSEQKELLALLSSNQPIFANQRNILSRAQFGPEVLKMKLSWIRCSLECASLLEREVSCPSTNNSEGQMELILQK